jgi:hypothetical protein
LINPFKNLQVNLQASGPAAVLCVLFICIASLGVFGQGAIAEKALNLLAAALGIVGTALALRS